MFVKQWGLGLVALFGLAVGTAQAAEVAPADAPKADAPRIQMAILLDNSGSMSGLINQARQHLWKVVNEFAVLRHNGQPPRLEVALYQYGNGQAERLVELTDDLDKVSQELFAISINGGSEYCGQVIQTAVRDLKWSQKDGDMKCIFIAGNEAFTQGPVDYQDACKEAIQNGITVSTIHCGPEAEGINGKWQDGALLADGSFLTIDQNQVVAAIDAPQDKKIAELNAKLNTTYIAFGNDQTRQQFAQNQVAQDANAANLNNTVLAQRAMTKCLSNYVCQWDLLDAYRLGKIKLEDIKKEELPKELQKLSTEELKAHVAQKQQERKTIQEKLTKLTEEREKYVAEERKKLAQAHPENTLDAAIIKSVHTQAKRQGYEIGK